MPAPLLLGAAMIAPQLLGMVQTGMMMHQMNGQNEKNEEAMKQMLGGGQGAQASLGGLTGAPVPGQTNYQPLA